jgi:predicted transcriptional regulator
MALIAHKLHPHHDDSQSRAATDTNFAAQNVGKYPIDVDAIARRHIAQILGEVLRDLGLSRAAVARLWGVTPQSCAAILDGEKPLSIERVGQLPKPARRAFRDRLNTLWGLDDEETVSTLLDEAVSLSVAAAEVLDAARRDDREVAARAVIRAAHAVGRAAKAARSK